MKTPNLDKLPPGIGKSIYPTERPDFNSWIRAIYLRNAVDLGQAFEKLKIATLKPAK